MHDATQKPWKPHKTHRSALGKHFSEGARQMWLRLAEKQLSPAKFGTQAGWATGCASRYLYGDRLPTRKASLYIHAELGVDPALFDVPPAQFFDPRSVHAAYPAAAESGVSTSEILPEDDDGS